MFNNVKRFLNIFFSFVLILSVFLLIFNSSVRAQYSDDDDDDDDGGRACWVYCAWQPCQTGLACIKNKCRNADCIYESDCCCYPSDPANLSPSGSVSSVNVTFSWDSVSDASYYAFRINDTSNAWCDTPTTSCTNPANCTLYSGDYCTYLTSNSITRTLTAGHTYTWWVHAVKTCPNGDKWSDATTIYVTAPNPTSAPTPTSTNTPTPTRTPTPTPSNWYKLKNASLYKKGGIDLVVPSSISAFDATSDDTTEKYLIISSTNNSPGVVTSNGPISYTSTPAFSSSSNGWQNASYSFSSQSLISNFYEYIEAKKEYETIDSLSSVVENKINIINSSNLNITDSSFSESPLVLVVRDGAGYGNITVGENLNKEGVVFVANTITFESDVSSVEGIFIANDVEINTTTGFKIKGNLVSENEVAIPNRTDTTTKPSVFVIFDPTQYVNLLPLISNSKYDFQQTQ